MTTATAVTLQRSGQAIRAALLEHSPDDADLFEAEMRAALVNAAEDLDLAGPAAVLERWHARATMAANPLSPDELSQLERARAGDVAGLHNRDEQGQWVRL